MVLRIRYPNLDFDYISAHMLDNLINSKKIIQFYRPSEERWADIERDPTSIRRTGRHRYDGVERRAEHLAGMQLWTMQPSCAVPRFRPEHRQ